MNKQTTLAADEAAYLMGSGEPATSSVLISNSKYLNSPLFRDVYAQMGLKRDGHDLPDAYLIPALTRAMGDVVDPARTAALLEEERARLPEFAAWLDERFTSNFTAEQVADCKPGTLGARIHAFIADSGYQIDFLYKGAPASDYEFLVKRRAQNHDIEHMVTGLCPSQVGEIALIVANTVANANYFSTDFAHELNLYGTVLMSTSLSRSGLHYPKTLPSLLEGISRGYQLGAKQKRPLFMIRWEDHLDRPIADIRAEFGFEDGPEPGYWDWVFQAFKG
ncbi:Coq4 family protein [Sphingomonas jatrophae]|uniref:Ubiquinone biosynthesis protein Coq4 n=1 Tax=Sphingomonas jatrophae TaxID=1166337 RepID=A0A1I6KBQ3_9SPHN|nr:Coq4 family protein [Sphingomonas jatrophae]SFR88649.1 Ubiquinone biosynthesis protein Coq4 [Sphingomonas jatrophae]